MEKKSDTGHYLSPSADVLELQKPGVLCQSSRSTYKINIAAHFPPCDSTSAYVKTSWKPDDKLLLWLDQNIQETPDLVIKYDGKSWVVDEESPFTGNKPAKSNGDMLVAYFRGYDLGEYTYEDLSEQKGFPCAQFKTKPYFEDEVIKGKNNPCKTSMTILAHAKYVYAHKILSSVISGWNFESDVQVVVSGLSGEWALSCNKLVPSTAIVMKYREHDVHPVWETNLSEAGFYTYGWDRGDGKVFYLNLVKDLTNKPLKFNLYNLETGEERSCGLIVPSINSEDTKLKIISISADKVQGALPQDALPGEFSVSENKKVHFAKGNLKYQITGKPGWGFFDHQYDCDPGTGKMSSQDYVSLFAWGWTEASCVRDHIAHVTTHAKNGENLTYQEDWGSHMPQPDTWRTLSNEEWIYLISGRNKASEKVGFATVCGHRGMIILPDKFTDPNTNGGSKPFVAQVKEDFSVNMYTTEEDWMKMEKAGALFLPASGVHSYGTLYYVGTSDKVGGANYWSSTAFDEANAYVMGFDEHIMIPSEEISFEIGCAVRLVVK